jgi:hypothetical protein
MTVILNNYFFVLYNITTNNFILLEETKYRRAMRRNIILFRGNKVASLHPNRQLIGSGFKRKHSRHYTQGGAISLPSFLNKLSLDPVSTAVVQSMPQGISDFITHRGGAILKARPKGKKPIKFLL